MRCIHTVSAVFTIVACAALAPASKADTSKPPWAWTTEERIAARVDITARQARLLRATQGRLLREQPRVRTVATGWSPIDGSTEPQLFFPEELLARLVDSTDQQLRAGLLARTEYRKTIARAGWDYESFWNAVDSASAQYLTLMRASAEIQRASRGQADMTRSDHAICTARAGMLSMLRSQFGVGLDEFLYTSVAPHLSVWVRDTSETTDSLRNRFEGCK